MVSGYCFENKILTSLKSFNFLNNFSYCKQIVIASIPPGSLNSVHLDENNGLDEHTETKDLRREEKADKIMKNCNIFNY